MQHHGDIGILCDTSVSPENLEPWRCWERFTIIDAGNARIALYSWTFRRFVRVLPDGKVDGKAGVIGIDALPPESVWSAERFSMISVENNLYMFCNPASNRFLSLRDSKVVGCHGPSDTDRPSAQFQVVMHLDPLPSLMKKLCGRSVALYNPFHQRFIKMQHNGDIGVSDKASINPDTLEAWRVGERFIVTDTGNSKIALYNSTFRRFVRVLHDGTVDGKGGVLAMNELPPESLWFGERFLGFHVENDLYMFCNPASNRFLSLRDSKVVGCHGLSDTDRPSAQFQVIFQLLPDPTSATTKEEVVSTGACDNEIVASETMGVKAPRSSIDPMLAANRIIPTAFLCPITHELMRDPVILVDGHTYERRAIVDWLDLGKVTSPVTNEQLQNAILIPNYALRSAISLFLNS